MRSWYLLSLLGITAAAVVVVVSGLLPVPATRLVADVTGLFGALAATVAFGLTAWRRPAPGRWPMTVGLAGWASGQAVWTWHRSVDRMAMTFPNVENALYLVLPVCAATSLLITARRVGGDHAPATPPRVLVLDALLLCVSAVGLTWETTVGAAAMSGLDAETVLASIYPVSDLGLIMLALVLALGLRRMWRRPLAWLIAGMGSIGFSDVVYAYCNSADLTAPTWADAGYMTGPWLLVVCGLVRDRPFRRRGAFSLMLLPYLPLAAALGLTLLHAATAPNGPAPAEIYFLVGLLCLVVVRQLISQTRLASAHAILTRHAHADPLTGAANRAGLYSACRRVLHHDREEQLGVVFCDLDQFKPINDQYGHGVGDSVLQVIAQRLQACVRKDDVVARYGGDEFVVVLDPAPPDPTVLTQRVADTIAAPMTVQGRACTVTASIGYSIVGPDGDLDVAITAADQAMYTVKPSAKVDRGRR